MSSITWTPTALAASAAPWAGEVWRMVEAQHAAVDAGWLEFQHVGGELDMTTLVNLMYLAPDGTLTGLDGGNGRIELTTRDGRRIAGRMLTEAREAPMNETDMSCAVDFDLTLGWPGAKP